MKRLFAAFAIVTLSIPLMIASADAQEKPGWPKGVTIGAAPLGGTYFIWAGGFAKVMNDKVGVQAKVESTGGPNHNTQLVQAKQLDLGMVTSAIVYEAFVGDLQGWTKGKKHPDVRVIFPMYTTYFQMYSLKKTNINSIMDLNGKSVGVGPVGGTPATTWPKIFEVAGVKPSRITNASSADLNSQVKDGTIDAHGQAVGLPWVTITEIETTNDVNAYGVPVNVADKFIEKFPSFAKGLIPKGTYKSNPTEDLPTLTVWNFMIVHKDASDDFIYEVVKKTFENVDILIAAHPSAAEVKIENIAYSPIPLHPGAVKYYKEKGIQIPDKMIAK
jgi:uncharacterized protein